MPEILDEKDISLPDTSSLKEIARQSEQSKETKLSPSPIVEEYAFDRPNLGIVRRVIDSIRQIRSIIGPKKADGKSSWETDIPELTDLEENPDPNSISIGLEIEIGDSTLLTSDERKLDRKQKEEIVRRRREELKWLEESGLKLDDSDPWLEYALEPSSSFLAQLAQIELLTEAGAIDLESHYYSLHINLGGISSEKIGVGQEVGVLARALEATGWGASRTRLMMPIKKRNFNIFSAQKSWNTPDFVSGFYERLPETVEQSTTVVEFRTFMAHGGENLKHIVEAAYFLGVALSSYQDLNHVESKRKKGISGLVTGQQLEQRPRIKKGASYETAKLLADQWAEFSSDVREVFRSNGLRDPSLSWKEPKSLFMRREGDFAGLAEAIETNTDFVEQIRSIIQKHVNEIKIILQNQ